MTKLNSKIPSGSLFEKWSNYKANQNLVNPANKRKLDVIVVGTGLVGASAAASGTNTITGVIGQWLDSVSVLYLSGQVKS